MHAAVGVIERAQQHQWALSGMVYPAVVLLGRAAAGLTRSCRRARCGGRHMSRKAYTSSMRSTGVMANRRSSIWMISVS